ncbi:hypothetical protein QQ008_10180 [Fulvivirgaceae bacterium BMA10]|uniref:Outer membrane protein beta-barrel domain-containing protein n=1 Tax=Splendidivirga corallicola TaxID=3051826 RepID=A0ABT8KMR4_9BACT|nr:hypothetical protein [Fulvivirgaceae bacterium BMA10]
MRYIVLLLIFAISSLEPLTAQDFYQDDQEIKTLLGSKTKVSWFGSVDLKTTRFVKNTNLMVGGHGGVILDNRFMLALGGYGIATATGFNGLVESDELVLQGGYGGILIGYSLLPREIVHVNFPVLIGGGGFQVYTKDDNNNFGPSFIDELIESKGFFIVEPGVEVEVNIVRFFKIALGASYRYIEGAKLDNVNNEELNDWSANLSFKFGKF